jgi:NAD+-dependent secondary alcohol dehydrogenase Adh1
MKPATKGEEVKSALLHRYDESIPQDSLTVEEMEEPKVEEGYVDTVLEMTDGKGAEVVFDYVGERGAEDDAWKMTRRAGSHFVIGYGRTVEVPTIDIISTERNVIGNLVGTYNDQAELMKLTARGLVTLHTSTYPLDAVNDAIQDLNNGCLQGRGILIPHGAT